MWISLGTMTVADPGSDEVVNIGSVDGSSPDIFRLEQMMVHMMLVYKELKRIGTH